MKLREIAHSRTGDKGNISNISLIAFKDKDYELIKEKVTEAVVKEWFQGCCQRGGRPLRVAKPPCL